ncbi:MAG: response regulator [Pseudomonadota bacterium]
MHRPATRVHPLRRALLALAATVILAPSAPASAQECVSGIPPINVGVTPQEAALIYRRGTDAAGPLADFWAGFASVTRCRLTYRWFDSTDEAYQALAAGEVNYLAGLTTRPDANSPGFRTLAFASKPIAGLAQTPLSEHDLVTQPGRVFAYDSSIDQAALIIARSFRGEAVATESAAAALELVRSGKADMALTQEYFGDTTAPALELLTLWRRPIYTLAATSELRDQFHQVLGQVIQTLPPGLHRFTFQDDPIPIDMPDLEWLYDHPIVTLGASHWAPLTRVDAERRATGFGINLIRKHYSRLGVTPYFVVGTWEQVVAMAENGEIDGLGFAAPSVSGNPRLALSARLFESPWVVMTNREAPFIARTEDLDGWHLAVNKSYGFGELFATQVSGLTVHPFSDSATALRAIDTGVVDGAIETLSVAQTIARRESMENLRVSLRLTSPGEFHTLIRADWPQLLDRLNQSIAALEVSRVNEILERSVQRPPPDVATIVRATVVRLSPVLLLLLAATVYVAFRYRRTARQLRAREKLLSQVARLTGAGSMSLSKERLAVSAEAHEVLGLAPAARLTLDDVIQRYERDDAVRLGEAVQLAQQHQRTSTLEVRSRGGPEAAVHRISLRPDDDSVLLALQDVTRIRREQAESLALKSQVIQLQKLEAIGTLAGGIAHDLNNTLTASIFFSEQAMDPSLEPAERATALEEVIRSNERSRTLVRQILDFSSRRRAEPGEPVDVSVVLKQVEHLLKSTLGPHITLSLSFQEGAWVPCPAGQLEQILVNLCVNAANAIEGPGEVSIAVDLTSLDHVTTTRTGVLETGGYARLRVADTGAGMSAEVLERCLEPFFTTASVHQGTGLGLSIIRGILTAHGGGLNIESAVGEGTRISVYLPLAQPADHRKTAKKTLAQTAGAGQHVLVVDDDPLVLRTLARMLEAQGYQVTPQDSASAALEQLSAGSHSIDVVLTDYRMPEMTGLELAAKIRRFDQHVRIVLATGYGVELAQEALEQGVVNTLVQKPIESRTIARELTPEEGVEQGVGSE